MSGKLLICPHEMCVLLQNRHTAMQPLKQVLHQIDEGGTGRVSYHDFYVSVFGTLLHNAAA